MKLYTSLNNNHHYRLLQLNSDLIKALENDQLIIKSSGPELVVCTDEKTYQVRQMNQSNTLLLTLPCEDFDLSNGDGDVEVDMDVESRENDVESRGNGRSGGSGSLLDQIDEPAAKNTSLVAFGSAANFLEACEMNKISLDVTRIPVYLGDGELQISQVNGPSMCLKDLRMNSPMSDKEFNKEWAKLGGVEIELPSGLLVAAIPNDNTVRDVLTNVLTSMVIQIPEWKSADIHHILHTITPEQDGEPQHIIQCIMNRFITSSDLLDMNLISKFYGIQTLHSLGSKPITKQEFIRSWTKNIPVSIDNELSLALLSGHHMCPTDETICYFSESLLSTNPKIRFNQILSAKPLWEMNEILPFIEPVRHNKAIKMENFVMKYAKRRKVGKRILISAT